MNRLKVLRLIQHLLELDDEEKLVNPSADACYYLLNYLSISAMKKEEIVVLRSIYISKRLATIILKLEEWENG